MSRLLLLVAIAALLAPAAMALPPDPDVSVSLTVPDQDPSMETTAVVPVTVNVLVENLACLPGPGKLVITFTTAVVGDNITVDPIAPISVVMPTAAPSVSSSPMVQVIVHSQTPAIANVTVTPNYILNDCTGASASGAGVAGSFPVEFQVASVTPTETGPAEAPVPGFELPLLALAVIGAVLLARRKA